MMKNYIKVQNNGRYDFQVALQQAYVLISRKKKHLELLPDLPSPNRFLIKIQYGDKKVHVKVLDLNKHLHSEFIAYFMTKFMHLLEHRILLFLAPPNLL